MNAVDALASGVGTLIAGACVAAMVYLAFVSTQRAESSSLRYLALQSTCLIVVLAVVVARFVHYS
jgi:hypothetical protein